MSWAWVNGLMVLGMVLAVLVGAVLHLLAPQTDAATGEQVTP